MTLQMLLMCIQNVLLNGLEELAAREIKVVGGIENGYITMLGKWFEEKFPIFHIKGSNHVESQMKNFKRSYNQTYDLKYQSGGWDREK